MKWSSSIALIALVAACEWSDGRRSPATIDAAAIVADSRRVATADAPAKPPIDAPHVAACTLVPQDGCAGATPACDVAPAQDGSTACRAVTARGGSTSHCSQRTDCMVGYTCIEEDPNAPAWCTAFCAHDVDCSGAGSRCVHGVQNHQQAVIATVCTIACSPTAQTGCPSGMACVAEADAAGDYTDCVYVADHADGTACANVADCRPGSACIVEGTAQTCEPYCIVGGTTACPTGTTCQAFTPALVIGAVQYGACHT
jgi:hypothetical protein